MVGEASKRKPDSSRCRESCEQNASKARCAQKTKPQRKPLSALIHYFLVAGATRLELATSGVTDRLPTKSFQPLAPKPQSFQSVSFHFVSHRVVSCPKSRDKTGTKFLPFPASSRTVNTRPQTESKDFAETEQEHTCEYNQEHSQDDIKYTAS